MLSLCQGRRCTEHIAVSVYRCYFFLCVYVIIHIHTAAASTLLTHSHCCCIHTADTFTLLPHPHCWHIHTAAASTLLTHSHCCRIHTADTFTLLPHPHCWHIHTAAASTLLTHSHCCRIHTADTFTLLPHPHCWHIHTAAASTLLTHSHCWYIHTADTFTLLAQPQWACSIKNAEDSRAIAIYRSIDIIAAIRCFWRYRDIFYCSDIGDTLLVHLAVILVKISFCREVFWMFWLFSLFLFTSSQNHEKKKLDSRHRFVSYMKWRRIWKSWGHWNAQNRQMVALKLPRGRKKFGEQQGSRMLALRCCRKVQCRRYW